MLPCTRVRYAFTPLASVRVVGAVRFVAPAQAGSTP